MVNRRKSLLMRDAMSINTIPSAPNADETATFLPKVWNAQLRTCCGDQVSATACTWVTCSWPSIGVEG